MKRFIKNRMILVVLVSIIGMFFCKDAYMAKSTELVEQNRVLFISSYSYAWETVPEQIEGIQEAFDDAVEIEYKFMDTKNMTSAESEELFYQSMKQYMKEVEPYDGIIVGDDAALLFVKEHREELFAGIPVVFEGINDVAQAEDAVENMQMTGVLENLSYYSTIKLATELYPKATQIVAILDNTVTGEGERIAFYAHAKDFPQLSFSEINAEEYTREELKNKVAELDKDTILLYIMCSLDKEGQAYTSYDGGALISASANIPTFTVVSIGMGSGVLGGEVVSQKQMGYIAADMLKQCFAGKSITDIKIQKDSPRQFTFDENVMKRFKVNVSELPEDSDIVNHEETFLEKNSEILKIAAFVGVVLIILVLILARDNLRRRKMTEAMRRARDNMEQAARFDNLTGLKNRLVFSEDLQSKINAEDKFGIILFDIDGFKQVNDTLGHNNGDVVLKELADRVSRIEDEYFQVYRLAGDEFTALVTARDKDIVFAYAKEIRKCFKKAFLLEKQKYPLSSSIGIAMYPVDGATSKEIIAAADAAMYHVKRNGKNNIEFFQNI
ncbi:MAG: diguanylate cyclase [Lachnospiraceae bacterium]|nr:diguanylate cyclase [Lachnospiraceae bacterium]